MATVGVPGGMVEAVTQGVLDALEALGCGGDGSGGGVPNATQTGGAAGIVVSPKYDKRPDARPSPTLTVHATLFRDILQEERYEAPDPSADPPIIGGTYQYAEALYAVTFDATNAQAVGFLGDLRVHLARRPARAALTAAGLALVDVEPMTDATRTLEGANGTIYEPRGVRRAIVRAGMRLEEYETDGPEMRRVEVTAEYYRSDADDADPVATESIVYDEDAPGA